VKSKNPNQIISHFSVGRNDACPCGSNKKFKKCCKSQHHFFAKRLAQWLQENDEEKPIDYKNITNEEFDDINTLKILLERKQEIEKQKETVAV
jgi:hypothetical protein